MSRAATKALIGATMDAFAARGCPVRGARICGNGDVLLLTEAPTDALPSNDQGEWVDLAGETEVSGAKRA